MRVLLDISAVAKIRYKGSQLVFWDLGGQSRMRRVWEAYYSEANCVVFVVDAADPGRLEDARQAFGECSAGLLFIYIYMGYASDAWYSRVATMLIHVHMGITASACGNDILAHTPVLVLANKQDLPVSIILHA